MGRRIRPIPPGENSLRSKYTSIVHWHPFYGGAVWTPLETIRSSGVQWMKNLTGTQITESVNNPAWKGLVKGHFKGDVGGPFFSQKSQALPFGVGNVRLGNFEHWANPPRIKTVTYDGPMLALAPQTWMMQNPNLHSSPEELAELGATAISRCSPTNPVADLSVYLGELVKEGIPALVGATLKKWRNLGAKERRRAVGSEYLNYEFGWKPMVDGLMEIVDAIDRTEDILRQYERDSNRLVRRSYSFPPSEEIETTVVTSATRPWLVGEQSALSLPPPYTGKVIRTRKVAKTVWFSGGFSYYYPPYDGTVRTNMARHAIEVKKTLGVKMTPGTIWNLAPWSWAIDWFSNIGDVLENVDSWIMDGLVVRYGYIMETTIVTDTYTFIGPTGYLPASAVPSDITIVFTTKQRGKASPYGFGMTWADFTPRQIAIATSLGLSRS